MNAFEDWEAETTVIYDGECPFCSRYAEYAKLRATFPNLKLVNARDFLSEAATLRKRGFDLNQGMLVIHRGSYFFGPEAMTFLAKNGVRGLFQPLQHSGISKLIYPVLRRFRNAVLFILGRHQL